MAALQHELIKCSVCHEDFIYGGGEIARHFGWQHTKKHGWRCPSHASKSKFNAVKTELDGHVFASQAEAVRYSELKFLQDTGHIRHLELQPRIELQPAFRHNGKWERPIFYVGDFRFLDCATGEIVVEEIKGAETATWKLKRKMVLYKFPKLDFRIIKA